MKRTLKQPKPEKILPVSSRPGFIPFPEGGPVPIEALREAGLFMRMGRMFATQARLEDRRAAEAAERERAS